MIVEYTRYKIPKESIEFEVAYEKAQESLKVSPQCLRYEISHFAVYQSRETPNPKNLYFEFAKSFAKTLDHMNRGDREEGSNGRRKQITLHSFRRFVKSTISDLGYGDYSEWFIGHSGSTYYRKTDKEKAEIFSKIEPYLTFLNIHQLERQGADIQSKVEELEELNQALRNRDKMKDDAIAQLSDQVMALTARMQEIERMQQ